MQLSLVLPCFNEALNIKATITEVWQWSQANGYELELITVNDGSTDETGAVLEQLATSMPITVIHHATNQGYGAAIIIGCNVATQPWIAYMDSDGQFKADGLAKLVSASSGQLLITGYRAQRADPWLRKLDAFLYGCLVRFFLGVKKPDINCGLNLFKAEIWPTIRPRQASGALFAAEMFWRAQRAQITYKLVPVPHYPRQYGQPTGVKPGVVGRMLREMFNLKFESYVLRDASRCHPEEPGA